MLWTNEENEVLINHYSSKTKDELLNLLPNRVWKSINTQASKLKCANRHKWTDDEINIMKINYSTSSKSELIKLIPNRDYESIKSMASKLGIKKHWSDEENEKLINNYPTKSKNELIKLFPNRSFSAIQLHASNNSIGKVNPHRKNSDLSVLLDDTPLTYYYIGFIMADGCFTGKYLNRLLIKISNKDEKYLVKFANYIKTKIKYINKKAGEGYISKDTTFVEIDCVDNTICPIIRDKFDFKKAKTYNPPERLPTENKVLLCSLLAGILDGDGYICMNKKTNKNIIQLQCHKSWFNFFKLLDSNIFSKNNPLTITKRGLISYSITRKDSLKFLIDTIEPLNLPLFDRKWSRIINQYS